MLKSTIVLVLLGACADLAADPGTVYKCSAVFECDGVAFDITPSTGCASDPGEALALYEMRLDVITKDAKCATRSYAPTCADTGERCIANR
jgi:hypothetical protein